MKNKQSSRREAYVERDRMTESGEGPTFIANMPDPENCHRNQFEHITAKWNEAAPINAKKYGHDYHYKEPERNVKP